MLSRDEVLERIPTLEREGLRGGVKYHDGQFDDSRLLVNLAQTAAEQGACLLNYARVVGLLKDADGFVERRSRVRDQESGAAARGRPRAASSTPPGRSATGCAGSTTRRRRR